MTIQSPASTARANARWMWLRHPASVFLVSAALRIIVLYVLVAHSPVWWGINEAGTIGRSLVLGHGFASPFHDAVGPSAWFAPVYPCLMAAIFLIFGIETAASAWAAALLNVVFASLTALVIRQVGREHFSDAAGDIGSWAWAVSPPLLIMPWLLWETCLSALAMSLAFLLLLRLTRDSRLRNWAACGCIWGFAGLLNPALLAPLPALGLRAVWRRSAKGFAILLLMCAVVILPWTARNERQLHHFVPVRSNLWPELFFGNAGFALHPHGSSMLYQQEGEMAFSADMRMRLMTYLRTHSGEFLQRTGRRIIEFWIEPTNFGPSAAVVSLLALIGVLRARSRRREWTSFASVVALYPLLYYLTFTFSRFRYPLDPLLYVLAGYAISEVVAYGRGRAASGKAE